MITKGISAGDIENIHREYTPQITGVSLFPGEIKVTGVKTIYKSRIDFDNVDYVVFDGDIKSSSAGNAKILYFKIGGVTKITLSNDTTGFISVGNTIDDSYVDCTSITGNQDVEAIIDDSTTGYAYFKNISISFVRS